MEKYLIFRYFRTCPKTCKIDLKRAFYSCIFDLRCIFPFKYSTFQANGCSINSNSSVEIKICLLFIYDRLTCRAIFVNWRPDRLSALHDQSSASQSVRGFCPYFYQIVTIAPSARILRSRVTSGKFKCKAVAAIMRSGISGTVSRSISRMAMEIARSIGTTTRLGFGSLSTARIRWSRSVAMRRFSIK